VVALSINLDGAAAERSHLRRSAEGGVVGEINRRSKRIPSAWGVTAVLHVKR